jgi:3-phosphoshikimate 1-carboxyvinyltransferase
MDGEGLRGVDVDLSTMPDTALSLAALAPFAGGPTRIRGIASARYKECDRIFATAAELRRLGVAVDEHEDGLTIYPAEHIQPAEVRTYNDHRMAMAFTLIGLRVPGVRIEIRLRFQDVPGILPGTGGFALMQLGLIGFPLEHSLSRASIRRH